MTPSRQPSSLSVLSCSWAARMKVSSGTNMITKSGDGSNWRQYDF